MEKIVVTENKPSFFYGALTNIASLGKPNISKWLMEKELKKTVVQNSYKTNILKFWVNNFSQKYINGIQTFIINENATNALVYFHGGAYLTNPTMFHFNFIKKLAKITGFKIYFVLYPRLPKYTCAECVKLLEGWFNEIPEKNVMIGGDSSGGGLAISISKYLTENKLINVDRVFALSPWLAPLLNNEDILKYEERDLVIDYNYLKKTGAKWVGALTQDNYLHSPINICNWQDTPLLILSGSEEMLAPDIKKFCENNSSKDILWYEFDKMQHVFTLYPCKEGKKSIKKVADFLLCDNFLNN